MENPQRELLCGIEEDAVRDNQQDGNGSVLAQNNVCCTRGCERNHVCNVYSIGSACLRAVYGDFLRAASKPVHVIHGF